MLGSSYDGDGTASGNVQYVTGLSGTIVDGLSLDYLYNTGPDYWVDFISADGGTLLFESQDSKGRVVCYDGPSDNYRTINSSVVFGALRDGTSTKNELMDIYMDYLTGEITGIEGCVSVSSPAVSFQNPCRGSVTIHLYLPSPGNVNVIIYDMSGHLVGEITDGYLPEGSHSITWNGGENSLLETGTYLLLLQTEDQTLTRKVLIL